MAKMIAALRARGPISLPQLKKSEPSLKQAAWYFWY